MYECFGKDFEIHYYAQTKSASKPSCSGIDILDNKICKRLQLDP